jgi:hypothetical protein
MKRLASSQSDRKAKETRDQTEEEKETDCQSGFLDVKIMDSSETHQTRGIMPVLHVSLL